MLVLLSGEVEIAGALPRAVEWGAFAKWMCCDAFKRALDVQACKRVPIICIMDEDNLSCGNVTGEHLNAFRRSNPFDSEKGSCQPNKTSQLCTDLLENFRKRCR